MTIEQALAHLEARAQEQALKRRTSGGAHWSATDIEAAETIVGIHREREKIAAAFIVVPDGRS